MREYLKNLRASKGATMQEVADAFGITRQSYEMIESGERQKNMDITTLTKIADFFGVPIADIVKAEKDLLTAAEATE